VCTVQPKGPGFLWQNKKGDQIMKKKTGVIISLVTFLLVGILSSTGYADGHYKGKGCDHGRRHGLAKKISHKFHIALANEAELGLSEEQYEQIRTLKMNTKKDLIKKRAETDILKIDIKAKLWEDTIDKKSVNALIDKKYELKKAKAKALIEAYAQFKNILTAEQKKTFKAIYRQRHKK